MPIKIPNDLPAAEALTNENIFVMYEDRALHQDIRPLNIVILNLMPNKIATETQILRLLGNSPCRWISFCCIPGPMFPGIPPGNTSLNSITYLMRYVTASLTV